MWVAGDGYLDSAKIILDSTYANSRPSTVQALLLLGYREIGIGAMAQAWVYIGMAVRMAQDLGLHRSADGWARVGLGGRLFNEWELQERKRIWYSCIIMDKYVSTYIGKHSRFQLISVTVFLSRFRIGRPLAIFDRDYDTQLPSEEEVIIEPWFVTFRLKYFLREKNLKYGDRIHLGRLVVALVIAQSSFHLSQRLVVSSRASTRQQICVCTRSYSSSPVST